ncbi:Basigin [Orchesella cincta]|uniref:Basigin n=1 Tax=Orchesella cincta TaxID=48709 RepID=A0A1D2N8R6_ORCCI|nr:Basigin [Orchesella cincta]
MGTASANQPINVTIEDSVSGPDSMGVKVYRKFVERERAIELVCKAPVPNAQMTWFRIKDDKGEENMADVCIGADVELLAKEIKKPPPHCTVKVGAASTEASTLTLRINRARKGNEILKTISDFRKYVCRAVKEGNQDGQAYVEIYERVSADRKFDKGERSVSVIEGNELRIYCDVHGVDKNEFDNGNTKLTWTKDGQQLQLEEIKNIKRIGEYNEDAGRGRPFRVGFLYDMAEPEHRGQYVCQVVRSHAPDQETHKNGTATQVSFEYYVRVKDKLGALWPFLGICGEVVILCTIILIYEKRRNKQELDESDTDGSPDQ